MPINDLSLYKANPVANPDQVFNFDTILNNNWSSIEEFAQAVKDALGDTEDLDTILAAIQSAIEGKISAEQAGLLVQAHAELLNNPHQVSKEQVGLGNVLNVQQETPTGAQEKADAVEAKLDAHKEDLANPHQVTKAQVGLSNVENKTAAQIRQETGALGTEVGSSFPTTNLFAGRTFFLSQDVGDFKTGRYTYVGGQWV